MRVLVTGHKGYIGSVMVPMFQAEGYEVVGLDNDFFEGCIFGDRSVSGDVPGIPYVKKDIREVEPSDLNQCDAVVHLCALSNDPLGNFNPEITYEINYEATLTLAKSAKKAGVQRFLLSSSCSVYGESGADTMTEESVTNPITPYGVSKIRSEEGLMRLADSSFSPTLLRSGTGYGVSPMLRLDVVLNNLVAVAYTTRRILLTSDGTAWRPIVHIEDISRAFIAVLNAPLDLVHNQVFNVGTTKENYQIRELAEIVKETVPGSHVEYAKDAGPDKRSYRVDFSKIARRLPEFKPKWNAHLGAQQLYEAYKKVGFTLKDFGSPRYTRIKQLEKNVKAGRLDKTLRWREVGK